MPSVTSCTLLFNSQTSSTDELNRMTTSVSYRVTTDGIMGHGAIISGAQSASPHALPSYGATYSFQGDTNGGIYLRNFDVAAQDEEKSQKLYRVTTTYAPPVDGDITIFEPNPFLRDPVIWFDREAYTRLVTRDVSGKPIQNATGRDYDIPLEEEDIRTVIVVEFNVGGLTAAGGALSGLSQSAGYARFLRNAVNSTPWTFLGLQFPPRTVLAREVASSPPIVQSAYTYYHLSFRFVLANGSSTTNPNDPSTWDVPILEQGYYALRIPNQKGSEYRMDTDTPKNLRLDGTELPPDEEGEFRFWRVKREVDFNLLPFSG